VVSLALIGVLVLVYVGEWTFGFEPGAAQSLRSLVALGADSRDLAVGQGQMWRVVTAILLHASVAHLFGNCLALLVAGAMLERRLGGAWFAAIFTIGGLAGSLASLVYNPANMVGVGASGAIMALLVPALLEAYGHETVYTIKHARAWVLVTVITALAPTSAHVDYTAHIGGALAGGALGYLLLFTAPELHDASWGRRLAAGVALGGAALAIAGLGLVALNYPAYAAENAELIPDGELRQLMIDQTRGSQIQSFNRLTDLELAHPSDPRGHLVKAIFLLQAENFGEAETEARAALAQGRVLADDFPPETTQFLHGLLAMILVSEGRLSDARPEAREVCSIKWPSKPLTALQRELNAHGACR
jgi:rhomboid protease GluP